MADTKQEEPAKKLTNQERIAEAFARHYAVVPLEKMSKGQVKTWLRNSLPKMSKMGFTGEQLSKVKDKEDAEKELKIDDIGAQIFCEMRAELKEAGGFKPTEYASCTLGNLSMGGTGKIEFVIDANTFYRQWSIRGLEQRTVEIIYDEAKDQTTVKCSALA